MKVYTARQAILNRDSKVVAYELLYRDGESNSFPVGVDPHQATSRMILRTHLNEGLSSITGGRVAFINFTEKCLLSNLPETLPADRVVIEILETVRPTDEVYNKCRELYKAGYRLALDDFVYKKEWARFIKLVRFIKFDIAKTPLNTLSVLLKKLKEIRRKGNLKNRLFLLAERVETQEEFKDAKAMGFDYFQGYYFCKPELHSSRDVNLSQSSLMRLYQELCRKEMDFGVVSKCFENDEGLTFKLLKFMNSGVFGVTQPIASIKQAITYLGEERLRKFMTLLTTTEMAKGKPAELVRIGIVRAKTCESISSKVVPGITEEAFLAGMLSVLPAILERPMSEILESLPVTDDIRKALMPDSEKDKQSVLGIILKVTSLLEQGQWHLTTKECAKIRLEYDYACQAHTDAIEWAQEYETYSEESVKKKEPTLRPTQQALS